MPPFNYNVPAELFLAKPQRVAARTTGALQRRPRPSVTPSRTYAHPERSALGCRWGMSGLTATKFNDCMKVITIRCVSLSDRAQRHDWLGPPARRFSGIRPPSPGFKKGG